MAAPAFIRKSNNIVTDLTAVVDPSWRIVAQAANGQPVYESIEERPVSVPDLDPATGQQRVEFHPINGLPLYKRNRIELREEPFRFTLYDPKNGNVRREPYVEPTQEELRERDIQARKHELNAGLIHALAEANMSPADLVAAVAAAAQRGKSQQETAEYPVNYAPGRWRLSSGTAMQSTKEQAVEAEAALHN